MSGARRRAVALVGVGVGGFLPPLVLAFAGFRLTPVALALLLASCVAGGALGAWALRENRRDPDVPTGAFASLALLAAVGWALGFLLALA